MMYERLIEITLVFAGVVWVMKLCIDRWIR